MHAGERELPTESVSASIESLQTGWQLSIDQCVQILSGQHIRVDGISAGIAFSLSTFLFTLAFIVLDICIFFIRRRSLFQLEYKLRNSLGFMLAVPVAAAIVSFLGFSLDVLQPSRAAGIAVGIGWPFFLAAFFNASEAIGTAEDDIDKGGEDLE